MATNFTDLWASLGNLRNGVGDLSDVYAIEDAIDALKKAERRICVMENVLKSAVSHLERHHKEIGIVACEIITDGQAVLRGEEPPCFEVDDGGFTVYEEVQ